MRLIGVLVIMKVYSIKLKNDIGINVGTNEVRLWQLKIKKT